MAGTLGPVSHELLRPLITRSASAGIFLDFDGTLSQIVAVPSDARPVAGAREVLAALAERFAVVAIVSGRDARELVEWLGPSVEIWGVHGAQRAVGGDVRLSPEAARFAPLMTTVCREARERVERLALDGVIVEDKEVMVGLHFRNATDRERAARELDEVAADLAARHELVRAGGRLAYELRPPVEFTKATVVRERGAGLEAVAFAGDDWVDLPAFDALDELEGKGAFALRIAVSSDEAPRELLDRADVVVDGPHATVELLESLSGDGARGA